MQGVRGYMPVNKAHCGLLILNHPSLLDDRDGEVLFTLESNGAASSGALDKFRDHQEAEESDEDKGTSEGGLNVGGGIRVEEINHIASSANLLPLPVAGDGSILCTVDEFGEGNVSMVAEDMDIAEASRSSIPETDAEEVTDIGGGTAAELNSDGRSVVGHPLELRALLGNTSLVEKGNEWLVGSFNQHELEGVAIEGNTLQGSKDSVHDGTTGNISNVIDLVRSEDASFVEVSPMTSLFDKRRRETVSISLVMGELRVEEIVEIPSILQSCRATKDKVLDRIHKRSSLLCLVLEFTGAVELLNVLLESWAVSPTLQGTIVSRFNRLNWDILVSSERGNDGRLIGEDDLVVLIGREETLEKSNGGVEDNCSLHTGLHSNFELVVINEVRTDALDVRG